ncbi:GIY-YIG nuclease family protein [Pelagibacterium flavum]|uniref:GIY-YIG nuclease family protein n=1 Tax=Pelagibacterium flavum TaxID=2984530 RepID=A0ABY6IRI4_9HYPH|nr:GIY-YIG nuclease family protein [Pelagibacterium sp. YIM 151497]MAN76501.1 excinuclease ABC subunit C [Hyphomicrobiales bacterium]UYQ73178.1 GIY-YIG nuclease family protein [Pelagibacterium sp. YIM 151497]
MPYYTYILCNRRNGTLYIGVTNDIARRVWEHRQGKGGKFTRLYKVHRLVYAEIHEDVTIAIQREKTLKEWPRTWKIKQIEKDNPDWDDLYERLI